MTRCVECGEEDTAARMVSLSYCEHRLCLGFRRGDCRERHVRMCIPYREATGNVPKTWVGPYPPMRPDDERTFIWSVCGCSWTDCRLESNGVMANLIAVNGHLKGGCLEPDPQGMLFDLPGVS